SGATATLGLDALSAGRYYARVFAATGCGNSEYSLVFEPGTPQLAAVQTATLVLTADGKPEFSWGAVDDAQCYRVERALSAYAPEEEWTVVADGLVNLTYVDASALGNTR
ncbi:MAG: hypothetical protein II655_06675, partial [Thermoguttaceae bacterium]|nr:hypothetical protein [Thermoguttaceae bacterium]